LVATNLPYCATDNGKPCKAVLDILHAAAEALPNGRTNTAISEALGSWIASCATKNSPTTSDNCPACCVACQSHTPHSDQLHVVERFSLDPAAMTLTREFRANDPLYLTETYTGSTTMILSNVPYAAEACEDLTPVPQQ
jgi:hypothetical protein